MTNVLFIRDMLYKLKQDYGQRMDLYVPTRTVQDYGTGKQTIDRQRLIIPQVILLSEILQRRFVHDVAFLTAGRNFAYGGSFDEGKRTIIISGNDMPKGIKIDANCYFVYLHIRYDVEKVEELEHRCAYIITMKQLNQRPSNEIVTMSVVSPIQFTGLAVKQ